MENERTIEAAARDLAARAAALFPEAAVIRIRVTPDPFSWDFSVELEGQ